MVKFTVCGGGNAAHVLMGVGSDAGWEVDVYAPFGEEAARLQAGVDKQGGIKAVFETGTKLGKIRRVSQSAKEVIPGSSVILIALPAFAHGPTLEAIAPYLDDGAVIGVLPARSGFDFQANAILSSFVGSPLIFGLQTLPWACRINSYGETVDVLGTKAAVDTAVSPGVDADRLLPALETLMGLALPKIGSFLALTLANTGQLIHPGIMYGVCGGREAERFAKEAVPLFYQGVDSHTADVLQNLSDEVQLITKTLSARLPQFDGSKVIPLMDWLLRAYPHDVGDTSSLQTAFNTNKAYAGLRVPSKPTEDGRYAVDFSYRYLAEDVPFGLVVLRGIAALAEAETPVINTVIQWAQTQLKKSYLADDQLVGQDVVFSRAPQAFGIQTVQDLMFS